jgi:hypothetical protein
MTMLCVTYNRREEKMSEVKELHIRCLNCNKWFLSPIFFGDFKSFDTSTMEGNQAQCGHCGKMTDCNKENMRVRAKGAGFVGKDT